MKTLEQLSRKDLLFALFSANYRLLESVGNPSSSKEEQQGMRVYLSAVVEEMGRRTQAVRQYRSNR
jgi:hypothetical protein